jgi:hypothetical protein
MIDAPVFGTPPEEAMPAACGLLSHHYSVTCGKSKAESVMFALDASDSWWGVDSTLPAQY